MKSPLLFATVAAAALGAMLALPQARSAPPCPECYWPYRACLRSAATPEQQTACADQYDQCLASMCLAPLTTARPRD